MWCVCRRQYFCSFSQKNEVWNTFFPCGGLSKPLTFHNGFMFFASRRSFKHFRDFKSYLICEMKFRKVLDTATRSKKHETIVEGQRLRKADIPTTADRERHTNRHTKSHSDAQDKQTHGHGHGHGHGTAQDTTGEQNRHGDTETTLTFRELHGNHIVSIPFETIVNKKKTQRDVEDYVLQ